MDVSVGVRGTPGNDLFYLKPSSDGATLEVYNVYPLNPGSTPIFAWPMNASVSLPIVTLGGDDKVLIDFPEGASGPAAGLKLDTGTGANNQLFIRGGNVRVDGVSTAGILKTTLEPGTQVSTSRLAQVVDVKRQ